jgi:hypothetical protein
LRRIQLGSTFGAYSHPSILNIGRMNDDAQQEAQSVDQDVPFATLIFLPAS